MDCCFSCLLLLWAVHSPPCLVVCGEASPTQAFSFGPPERVENGVLTADTSMPTAGRVFITLPHDSWGTSHSVKLEVTEDMLSQCL